MIVINLAYRRVTTMTLLSTDPLTQLAFSVHENKGVFAVLLGSGLSRTAQIPTGWEITLDLIKRIAAAQDVEEQTDWAQWYRDKTGNEPDYSKLLEDLTISPAERRSILHNYIEPNEEEKEEGKKLPTPAHQAIARLVRSGHIRVILTTNFDRLMENALREQGVEPTVISSVDSLSGAEPLTHSQCYLFKLHGDYKDARILNTDNELASYPVEYNQLLDRIIDEHGLIICGWSGDWDHALRAAILRAPNKRYPMFWAAKNPPGTNAQDLISHRQAKIMEITGADDFFNTLQQRVTILEQSRKQNPLSVELLTNSTKKYLAKAEFRIQLDELFSGEFERLLEAMNSDTLSPNGRWSPEEFSQRVSTYESITEPLGRMAGILGRWGEDKHKELIFDIINNIISHSKNHNGGLSAWINLRTYPAVMIMTAYALGLIRSRRWGTLHELFLKKIVIPHHEPCSIITLLFLWSWEGGGDIWKQLDGLDRRKTALSDHLLTIMDEWKSSFIGTTANFELSYDRYETLASLAYFEEQLSTYPDKTQIDIQYFRMPVGRVGWNSSSYRILTQELKDTNILDDLLTHGFANNSEEDLALFLRCFESIAGRMSW
ncbi:SIR2 family protein [Edwardsiella piscicida]|nr:SIR2 family protein [Edwardsiella piscicida]EKS7768546.1 SIR2 family protein [Edwardsiella piscicida]